MKPKTTCLFIVLIICANQIWGQVDFGYNLLPDNYMAINQKPTDKGQINRSKYWFGLANHIPDLINKKTYYPNNLERFYYFDNYLGIRLYDAKKRNNQSFASIKLKYALTKGETYRLYLGGFFPYNLNYIEDYIRKKNYIRSEYAYQSNFNLIQKRINDFSKIPLGFAMSKNKPTRLTNALINDSQTKIITASGYFKYYVDFTAEEASEYLTIGNFLQDKLPKETLFDLEKYVLILEVQLTKANNDNLIPNGDFEQHAAPSGLGQWWRLKDWFSPHPNRLHNKNDPSPDLITEINREVKSPIRGKGSARVGYINRTNDVFNEGLGVKLKQPLKKDKRYAITFNVGSTFRETFQFIGKRRTGTDMDSLKVQLGFSHKKPEQGNGSFLEAEQLLEYSQYLSGLFSNKIVQLTFTAKDDYEYFAFGYFEELDVPAFGQLGVMMDDLYLYEIPAQELSQEINANIALADNNQLSNIPKLKEEELLKEIKPKEEKRQAKIKEKPKTKEFYNKTDSTQVNVKYNFEPKSATCKLTVYDHGTEDGDIVTLKINDKTIVEHLKIRRRPFTEEFEIELKKGENFLYPIAENLGRIPPNTVQIIVDCKQKEEKSYRLFSKPGTSDALRLYYE